MRMDFLMVAGSLFLSCIFVSARLLTIVPGEEDKVLSSGCVFVRLDVLADDRIEVCSSPVPVAVGGISFDLSPSTAGGRVIRMRGAGHIGGI